MLFSFLLSQFDGAKLHIIYVQGISVCQQVFSVRHRVFRLCFSLFSFCLMPQNHCRHAADGGFCSNGRSGHSVRTVRTSNPDSPYCRYELSVLSLRIVSTVATNCQYCCYEWSLPKQRTTSVDEKHLLPALIGGFDGGTALGDGAHLEGDIGTLAAHFLHRGLNL